MPKKLTIADMRSVADARGGRCVSAEYRNSKEKLEWECSRGHRWFAKGDHILNMSSWCPVCAGKRLDISDMQRMAFERGGQCLSDVYIDSNTKYRWRCAEGHEWDAVAKSVKRGQWCPGCAGVMKLTIEEMKLIARQQGGEFLSDVYIDSNTKYRWRCAEGHEWEAVANDVKRGRWCRTCSDNRKIEELHRIAGERDGQCLSDVYVNSPTKYRWRCSKGHEWEAAANSVKGGTWCPECSSAKGEKLASEILNQTGHKFSKERPEWLRYSRGKKLELDCCCQPRAIALEYQGPQHYEEIPFFHRTKTDFQDQLERDGWKRQRCAENGVLLFEVRAVDFPTPEKVRDALASATQELAIPLEINPDYLEMLREHGLAYSPTQAVLKAA